MKKTYIQPSIEAVKIQNAVMQAASIKGGGTGGFSLGNTNPIVDEDPDPLTDTGADAL